MRAIDEIYTKYPFYGSRRIRWELIDAYGISICREHTQRLMREMGLAAIFPTKKPDTSAPDFSHKIYPFLLRGLVITHPNQVWGTDITYIRLEDGWAYLTAIMDWYSRYVISWKLSPTLETNFCLEALQEALTIGSPEIHNSDQGSQFTSHHYTDLLKEQAVQISMDGRGRCLDNIFTERLWRTVKYENIYLRSYQNMAEARNGLTEYFAFYNTKRRHTSLNNQTPVSVYYGLREMNIPKVEIKNRPLGVLS